MPYCTGDVHVGNRVVTYTDPTGREPADHLPPRRLQQHASRRSNYLHTRFPTINKLLITGFSAGGVASSAAFYQARRTLVPTQRLPAERLRPDLPGAERDLQLAAAARR